MNELLTSDHGELDELLERLFVAIDRENVKELFERLDIFWARLAMHIRAEHLHLFPAILRASESRGTTADPSPDFVRRTLKRLRHDHDLFVRELASAIKIARELVVQNRNVAVNIQKIRKTVVVVHRQLEKHNELEESVVYQWGEEFIDPTERDGLIDLMQKELHKLPPRFEGDRSGSRKRNYD